MLQEQIAVVKIVKDSQGEHRREMTLPSPVWDKIVSGEHKEANTTWELQKPIKMPPPSIEETELLGSEVNEKQKPGPKPKNK